MYKSFHSGSNSSAGWYLSFWRRQAAISAETAITHSDDRTRDGRITIRTLRQRCASSLKRKAINSNSTNTICGCLLRAQRVIQTERSQSRPAETFRAPLRQKAVTTKAEQRAAMYCGATLRHPAELLSGS